MCVDVRVRTREGGQLRVVRRFFFVCKKPVYSKECIFFIECVLHVLCVDVVRWFSFVLDFHK
jgi:hypothetical protein